MNCAMAMFGSCNDILRLNYFACRAMDNEQELVCLQGYVVLENAALGDDDNYQARSNRTDASDYRCSFKACNDPSHQRSSHKNRPKARYGECGGSKKKSPEATPERTHLAPVHHAVARVVVADDMFIRVRVSRGDREAFDVDSGLLQLLDGVFGLFVGA